MLAQCQTGSQQQENSQRQAEPLHQILIITHQEIIWNRYNRYPALFRNRVVNPALIAFIVGNIRYITVRITDFLKDFIYIRLLFFYRQIAVIDGKHNITGRIAKVVIAVLRQLIITQQAIQTLRIKIHRQYIVIAKAHGHRQQALIILAVLI